MFSKAEAQKMKKEFWTSFADAYPRKWILYDTKIKDLSLKFYVDNKKAQVIIDIDAKDDAKRYEYYEKLVSLQTILLEEYIAEAIYERDFYLETGKAVSRVWVEMQGVSLYNMASWAAIFRFFNINMDAFERFFLEYEDVIKG